MNRMIECNLQLFADGGEGMPSGIANGSVGEYAPTEQGQVAADNGADTNAQNADAEYEANYKSMIASPEYKPIHEKYFKKEMGKRLKSKDKQIAELEAFKGGTASLLDKLAVKYGVDDPTDIDAIIKAADEDDSYYENYAYQHNVGIDEAKQLIRAERITAENDRRLAEEERMAAFQQQYNAWMQEAAMLQQFYPSFDFDRECNDPVTGEKFVQYINIPGVSVKDAYEFAHKDELMGGAMQYAYNTARQEYADARTARSMQPRENGTSGQQASAVFNDMSKLSLKQIRQIQAAVSRGEKVNEKNFAQFLR